MSPIMSRHAAKIVTMTIALVMFLAARPPEVSTQDRAALARALRFEPTYLAPAENGRPMVSIRRVNPSVGHIDAWISSVGAGVALADIAGSGLPADICLVDPRNDSVTVMPAPGTGDRFEAFALHPPVDGYDASTIAPTGCLPADLNEDGRMDVLVHYWGRTPVVFLRNGSPALSADAFTPREPFGAREVWNTNAAVLADLDGDGHPDLLFGNYFRDGDRVLDPAAASDVEMQHSMSRAANAGRKRLLLWKDAAPDAVSYQDFSAALTPEMANGWTLALAARDLDDAFLEGAGEEFRKYRGLPEVYVANDFGPDRLLLNRSTPGAPRFELVEGERGLATPRSKVLGRDSFKGMGVDFGDVEGNGRPAIAVSNISSPYALLESHFLFLNTGEAEAWGRHAAPFTDRSGAFGTWTSNWSWDVKFADLLNTGRPMLLQAVGFVKGERNRWPELQELAMGNDELLRLPAVWPRFSTGDDLSGHDHDRLFVPVDGGTFSDVWPFLGLDRETVSRGIATGDVFGDGRLSVAIARQWTASLFLRNVAPDPGRAIVVDLRMPGAVSGTRAAVGAEARVILADGRVVTSVVDGGSGHAGKRAAEIHLGLGHVPPDRPFEVEFRWRDDGGLRSQTVALAPGRHRIVLNAGDPADHAPRSPASQERAP